MSESRSPWIHTSKYVGRYMMDVEITLVALLLFSFACYGWRPVILTALSALTAVFCELVGNAVRHQRPTVFDGASLVTGTMIGLLMSPLTAYWVPILASAFAIVVVKIPFGGTGRNVFNPAAAGMALATQCFVKRVFTYPDPALVGSLPLDNAPQNIVTKLSPAADLAAGATSHFSFSDILFGEIAGPIGATAIFVLLAAGVFLYIRRTVSLHITLPFLLTCVCFTVLFPRCAQGSIFYNIAFELCSGYLLFAAIYLLNDPVTVPRHKTSRIVYGVLAGILVMIMRHIGRFEEGTCFAVLLMNAWASPLDRGCWYLTRRLQMRRLSTNEKRPGETI